jgi:hypothetical protein
MPTSISHSTRHINDDETVANNESIAKPTSAMIAGGMSPLQQKIKKTEVAYDDLANLN